MQRRRPSFLCVMTTYEICKRCKTQLALMHYSPDEDLAPYLVPTGHCYKCELEDDAIDYLLSRYLDRGPWKVHATQAVPGLAWSVFDGDAGYDGSYANKKIAERKTSLNNYWHWRDQEGAALPSD